MKKSPIQDFNWQIWDICLLKLKYRLNLLSQNSVIEYIQDSYWLHNPYNPQFLSGCPLKLHFQIPCVFHFSMSDYKFPHVNLRDLWLLHTQNRLGRLIKLRRKLEIFAANIEIPITFRLRELTTWANQIPCVLTQFLNSLCFFLTGNLFGHFPCFPCVLGTLSYTLKMY